MLKATAIALAESKMTARDIAKQMEQDEQAMLDLKLDFIDKRKFK